MPRQRRISFVKRLLLTVKQRFFQQRARKYSFLFIFVNIFNRSDVSKLKLKEQHARRASNNKSTYAHHITYPVVRYKKRATRQAKLSYRVKPNMPEIKQLLMIHVLFIVVKRTVPFPTASIVTFCILLNCPVASVSTSTVCP